MKIEIDTVNKTVQIKHNEVSLEELFEFTLEHDIDIKEYKLIIPTYTYYPYNWHASTPPGTFADINETKFPNNDWKVPKEDYTDCDLWKNYIKTKTSTT